MILNKAAVAGIVALFCLPAIAVDSYGTPEELHGVKTVYVDAGDDFDLHAAVSGRLAAKTGIRVVEDRDEAELSFQIMANRAIAKASAVRTTPDGKQRLLWTGKAAAMFVWDTPWHDVVDKFARVFNENQ